MPQQIEHFIHGALTQLKRFRTALPDEVEGLLKGLDAAGWS